MRINESNMFEIIKEIEETLRDFFHYTRVDAFIYIDYIITFAIRFL